MRNRFRRIRTIGHFTGSFLQVVGALILLPVATVILYWGKRGDGRLTLLAFVLPAALSAVLGTALRRWCRPAQLDMTGSMLLCAVAWIAASAFGALPFVLGLGASYLDAYFEAMSGFTTTGITVFSGLDGMARSIILWRAITQWVGGIGILSFFLAIVFRGGGAHHMFGAESHKISSGRPAPGLFNTLKILWAIYGSFTVASAVTLALEGMSPFDSICHSLTALSTGGFSPYDSSIEYYRLSGHPNYRLIEYTVAFFMMLGGINFLIHYRVLTGDIRALWDNTESRHWWGLLALFIVLIMVDSLHKAGFFAALSVRSPSANMVELERTFRLSVFQVISVITTTGFGTKDIGSDFFPALSKQLFLVMMVIGGCVGSTGGGLKVMRVAMLGKLIRREVFRLRVSKKASTDLVVDGQIVPSDEIHRVAGLFFCWIALLVVGGMVTAVFSPHGAWASLSGMFSALGNIGPCYISVQDMIGIHPVVKVTYIFGMLAGRLEILPVLLLFSRRAWA